MQDSTLPARPPRGPDAIQKLLRQLGLRKREDLLVLSRNNDPYYQGTPAHRRDAEWFAGLWREFGYTAGVHLRRVHYRLVVDGGRFPDGRPYENTLTCDRYLNRAGMNARVLGLLDPEAFADRRNAPPLMHVMPRLDEPEPACWWDVPGEEHLHQDAAALLWKVPKVWMGGLADPTFELPRAVADGYDYDPADQPALVEVWIEKSTMNDVLIPVCQQLNVNLLAGKGFQSITAVVALLRRAEAHHARRAHVLFISDFDPAGDRMPISVARQAQFWAEQLGIEVEVTVEEVALTADQVR
jgi:hypothetical protein